MSVSIHADMVQEPAARARPQANWPVAVLAVLALAALLVCAALGYRAQAASQLDAARAQGLEAARTAARVVLSYDYHHLDADFGRASGLLTGDFKKQYASATTKVVRPTATKTRAVVRADVRAASVVSATPERVVTLLFVNQTTTSNRTKEPRTDLNRVSITVERVGDRWLVSKVDAL